MSNVSISIQFGKADAILTFAIENECRAIVKPYPFEVDPLNVSFQGRLIPKRRHGSQNEFLKEYYDAERGDQLFASCDEMEGISLGELSRIAEGAHHDRQISNQW